MPGKSRLSLYDCDARRIALIKPSALGDIVHSLPVLTALRHRFPHAHITWIVNRGYEPLLRGHRDLDETLPFDRGARHDGSGRALLSYGRFLADLRRRRFDFVIDLQGLLRSALMVAATGAARRVGLSSAREGAAWSYTDVVTVTDYDNLHAVDRYWRMAEAFGVGDLPKHFYVPVPDDVRRWADEMLRDCPRPWLGLGVGSRWPTKRWVPEHFAELARRAQGRFGGTALFLGGGDETALAGAVRARLAGPARDLTGRTTLPQLAAVLERVDVLLANDTGPLHLAAALGRPVVAPYTCTSVRQTGPYGAFGGAVETKVWCQGSRLRSCGRMECMAELTPDRLWPHLHEILQTWQRRQTRPA
jgi:lipopolysaccharide heptosyltransferase I